MSDMILGRAVLQLSTTVDKFKAEMGLARNTSQETVREMDFDWRRLAEGFERAGRRMTIAITVPLVAIAKGAVTAAMAAEKAAGSFSTASGDLQKAIKGLQVDFGKELLPLVSKVVEKLTVAVRWFQNLSPPVKQAAITAGLLAAALGPVLLLVGNLTRAISVLVAHPLVTFLTLCAAIGTALGAWAAGVKLGGFLDGEFKKQVDETNRSLETRNSLLLMTTEQQMNNQRLFIAGMEKEAAMLQKITAVRPGFAAGGYTGPTVEDLQRLQVILPGETAAAALARVNRQLAAARDLLVEISGLPESKVFGGGGSGGKGLDFWGRALKGDRATGVSDKAPVVGDATTGGGLMQSPAIWGEMADSMRPVWETYAELGQAQLTFNASLVKTPTLFEKIGASIMGLDLSGLVNGFSQIGAALAQLESGALTFERAMQRMVVAAVNALPAVFIQMAAAAAALGDYAGALGWLAAAGVSALAGGFLSQKLSDLESSDPMSTKTPEYRGRTGEVYYQFYGVTFAGRDDLEYLQRTGRV